ncbi:radical SAM protein [bacterium]|nr:radical SAM protein [bacterium]
MANRLLPNTLIFEITSRCNLDCLHCYNVWKNPFGYKIGELPTIETLDLLNRFLTQTGAKSVTLTGGEPLLRNDLPEIISWLNSRKVSVNLISNGNLLCQEKWIAALCGKISIFELPLLSCEREIHDRMSGFDGAFDSVTRAIAELKLAGERVVSVFVATKLNLPTWAETLELAFALGVDGVMFNRFNPGGRGFQNLQRLQATPEELQMALRIGGVFSICPNSREFPLVTAVPEPIGHITPWIPSEISGPAIIHPRFSETSVKNRFNP